ncbi:hypothetical protein H2198_005413 [Neophaeococcomyces mojaviensis]|uniref:Uncharacterized protein n=1 Tax=Neophaeococcomyces mojaviensis TaxID=3383035 RepID=A0ACC3A5Q0_9EURO|nr:hypothetical protein H2198_005413 [Knufia sp. JES_112]
MDPTSPLTRETHDFFQPKIVQLYSELFHFNVQYDEVDQLPSEGFWREFFLHRPEKQKFNNILEPLTAEDLLHLQHQTQNFVRRAISEFGSGISPRNENALENLTAFFAAVLSKRYTNPSTDIIEVLAGLDKVDRTMADLVNGLDIVIGKSKSSDFRRKAIDTALAIVSGSYQTSLATYFLHKDFFHSLMKYVQETTESISSALSLLGLLVNHNKFESQNVYQNRMEDFLNEEIMIKLINGFAATCVTVRDAYVAIQDDIPIQWSIGSTLSYVGLRSLTPEAKKHPPPTEDEAKALFNALPSADTTTFLAIYSFVQANNIFTSHLLTTSSETVSEPPLVSFLSATSYLCHHAHRTDRSLHYALLGLFTIRLLVSDSVLFKRLSSADAKIFVRLARQRAPHLPHITTPRVPTTIILDVLTDTLSHNLRKRLPLPIYSIALTILHQTLTLLESTRTRLEHQWSYIWLSLISLLRFLTTYSTDLTQTTRLSELQLQIAQPLTCILAFSLLRGDNFLPDPSSYDDLFYKIIEAGDTILPKFITAYSIKSLPPTDKLRRATEALTTISSHYQNLLNSSKKKHQSPKEVQKVIGEGHETLGDVMDNISTKSGGTGGATDGEFACHEKWKESVWKVEIKRIVRTVVEDGKILALQ